MVLRRCAAFVAGAVLLDVVVVLVPVLCSGEKVRRANESESLAYCYSLLNIPVLPEVTGPGPQQQYM